MEYGHGGDVYRNRNVELDFSINVNPLGMPNFVWEAAMKSIALSTRYPDSTCGALRARMSELTGIPGRCGADLPAGADVMPEESRDPRPVFYGI